MRMVCKKDNNVKIKIQTHVHISGGMCYNHFMSERKKHVIGFIILIGICALALLFMALRPKTTGSYCEILVQGEVVDTLPLSENVTKRIDTSDGYNVIRIQDGSVCVSEADCHNQICVKSAPISTNSQVISCLPHGLIIRVVGTDEEVDSIAY